MSPHNVPGVIQVTDLVSLRDTFESKCRREDGHLVWSGTFAEHRCIWMVNGVTLQANRLAWAFERAEQRNVLVKQTLKRRCGNARCILPEHHRIVPFTPAQDVWEMIERAIANGQRAVSKVRTYREAKEAHDERPSFLPPAVVLPPIKLSLREEVTAPLPTASAIQIVGPYRSGGITVFTPWGTFMGELSMRTEEPQ